MTERRFDETRGTTGGSVRTAGGFWSEVSWPAIIAGTFVALAIIVLLWALGAAVGLSVRASSSAPASGYGWGAGIWGVIVAITAFFVGGWVATRVSLIRGYRGALNGILVWAVVISLLALGLGTSAMGRAGGNDSGVYHFSMQPGGGEAMAPSPGTNVTPEQADRDRAHNAATAAWWGFAGLLLALGAAYMGGHAGLTGTTGYTGRTTTGGPSDVISP